VTDTFYRDKSKGMIAGVCAGLAEYFGVNPALLRLIFVLLALSSGPGVAAYIILWVILPEKSTLGAPHEDAVRKNVNEIGAEARSLGQELRGIFGGQGGTAPSKRVMWLGGLLILIGLVSLAQSLHLFWWFRQDQLWALALIVAGVVLLSRALRNR